MTHRIQPDTSPDPMDWVSAYADSEMQGDELAAAEQRLHDDPVARETLDTVRRVQSSMKLLKDLPAPPLSNDAMEQIARAMRQAAAKSEGDSAQESESQSARSEVHVQSNKTVKRAVLQTRPSLWRRHSVLAIAASLLLILTIFGGLKIMYRSGRATVASNEMEKAPVSNPEDRIEKKREVSFKESEKMQSPGAPPSTAEKSLGDIDAGARKMTSTAATVSKTLGIDKTDAASNQKEKKMDAERIGGLKKTVLTDDLNALPRESERPKTSIHVSDESQALPAADQTRNSAKAAEATSAEAKGRDAGSPLARRNAAQPRPGAVSDASPEAASPATDASAADRRREADEDLDFEAALFAEGGSTAALQERKKDVKAEDVEMSPARLSKKSSPTPSSSPESPLPPKFRIIYCHSDNFRIHELAIRANRLYQSMGINRPAAIQPVFQTENNANSGISGKSLQQTSGSQLQQYRLDIPPDAVIRVPLHDLIIRVGFSILKDTAPDSDRLPVRLIILPADVPAP